MFWFPWLCIESSDQLVQSFVCEKLTPAAHSKWCTEVGNNSQETGMLSISHTRKFILTYESVTVLQVRQHRLHLLGKILQRLFGDERYCCDVLCERPDGLAGERHWTLRACAVQLLHENSGAVQPLFGGNPHFVFASRDQIQLWRFVFFLRNVHVRHFVFLWLQLQFRIPEFNLDAQDVFVFQHFLVFGRKS